MIAHVTNECPSTHLVAVPISIAVAIVVDVVCFRMISLYIILISSPRLRHQRQHNVGRNMLPKYHKNIYLAVIPYANMPSPTTSARQTSGTLTL